MIDSEIGLRRRRVQDHRCEIVSERLSRARWRALILRAQSGDTEAENVALRASEGLVWSFVRRYARSHSDRDEIAAAARAGVLTAIRRYDPKRPTRWIHFAWLWARKEVQRQLGILRPAPRHVSLDEADDGLALQERIAAEQDFPDLDVARARPALELALRQLNRRDETAIRVRFGLAAPPDLPLRFDPDPELLQLECLLVARTTVRR